MSLYGPNTPPDPPPPNDVYGFEVTANHCSRDGTVFVKGMTGRLLRVEQTKTYPQARVFIDGVTQTGDAPHEQSKWIPYSKIKVGEKWKSDPKDWKLQVSSSSGLDFYNKAPEASRVSQKNVFDWTLSCLIQSFVETPIPSTPLGIATYGKKTGSRNITSLILEGVKRAGKKNMQLYEVLNSSSFKFMDMVNAANYQISSTNAYNKGGIYIRFVLSGSTPGWWKPNTWYVNSHCLWNSY